MKYFLFLVIVLFTIPPASAAKLFEQYVMNNKGYTNNLDNKFNAIFLQTYPSCESPSAITRLKPKIIALPNFSELSDDMKLSEHNKINPQYGQWIERAIVNGCNKKPTINILAVAYDSDTTPLLYPFINGQTKIPAIHQARAEQTVYNTMKNNSDCSTPNIVVDTQFLGYKSKDTKKITSENQNLGWFERWIIGGCNVETTVNLAILPDSKTQYRYIAQVKE